MSEAIGYGYEAPPTGEIGGIEEFEPIKIMFLERSYPSKYLNELNEKNTKAAEECTLLGIDFVPKAPSFKEGGVMWKYAVVERRGTGEGLNEKTLLPTDEGLLEEPKYTYSGVIQQIPPAIMYEKKWDLGEGGNPAGTLYKQTIYPAPQRFLPPVWPPYDFTNRRKYQDIPDDDRSAEVMALRAQEQKRKSDWNAVITYFNSLDELEALKVLEMSISYRFLMGFADNGGFKYVRPAKGLTMNLRRGKIDSRYLNLDAYIYNKDKKAYDFFVSDVTPPDEISEYVADMIIATQNAARQKRTSSMKEPNF